MYVKVYAYGATAFGSWSFGSLATEPVIAPRTKHYRR